MQGHQRVVAWLHAITGFLLIGCIASLWFAAAQLAPYFKGSFVPGLTTLIGRPIAIFAILAGLLEMAAAAALPRGRGWARVTLIVFAVFQLPLFPIGTALSAYTLWAILARPDGDRQDGAGAGVPPAAPPALQDQRANRLVSADG